MNYGLGNRIEPFKRRNINLNEPVLVYRALNRKGRVYSLKQNGFVVGHTTCLMLANAKFIISKAGQDRARKTKERNVHAFVKGKICVKGRLSVTAEDGEKNERLQLPVAITYNPFVNDTFVMKLSKKRTEVHGAFAVSFNDKGMFGAMLETDPK